MPDEEVLLITAALVALLVEMLKIENEKVVLTSVVIGGILQGLKLYAAEFYSDVLPILITGLAASGFWEIGQRVGLIGKRGE